MMNKQSGFIDYVKADGKSFKMDNGNWYSVFKSDQLKAEKGDYVEFNFAVNGSFNNVKGTVSPGVAPAGRPITPMATKSTGGFTTREFPVPALSPERTIVRQNSLGHAAKIVSEFQPSYKDLEDIANKVIEVARLFEAYSCGDLDKAIVDAEVSKMLAKEMN